MLTAATRAPAVSRRGALIAVTALTVGACTPGGRRGANPPPEAEEIVIGASLELSGPAAALGILQERALRITAEQLDAERVPVGGARRGVRLIIRDNAGQARVATAVARQLIDQDRVHAVIAGTIAETALATVAVAEQRQRPMICLAQADEIVRPLARRAYVFTLPPDSAEVARRMVRVIQRQKLRRVALLAASGPYGDTGVRVVQDAVDTAGLDLVRVIRLPRSNPDLRGTAERLASVAPETVVIWATAPTSGAIAVALRTARYPGRFFLDPGAVAEVTLSGATAAAVEGSYVVHPAVLGSTSLTNTTTSGLHRRTFVSRYVQLYRSFTGFAPYASDALTLIAAAARLGSDLDPRSLRDRLETLAMDGIAGSYAFSPQQHGGMEPSSLAVFAVERGAWVLK